MEGHTFELETSTDLGEAPEAGFRLEEAGGGVTVIGYNKTAGVLFMDRTHSGLVNFNKNFPARTEAPLKLANRTLQMHILVDRNSVEVFADNGRVAMTNLFFPLAGAIKIAAYTKDSRAGNVKVEAWELKSTHLTKP